jgi:hypothetical protein
MYCYPLSSIVADLRLWADARHRMVHALWIYGTAETGEEIAELWLEPLSQSPPVTDAVAKLMIPNSMIEAVQWP